MNVLSVASELFPLVKTGGLADVVGALPRALAPLGIEVTSLVPGYPEVLAKIENAQAIHTFNDLFGGDARLLAGRVARAEVFVIDAPHLYARPGTPYAGPDGQEWPDNYLRFAALAWTAAAIARGVLPGFLPEVVHAHDWQAALTPAYLFDAGGRRPGTIVTIHNLAHQGRFPANTLEALRLPQSMFAVDGIEYYGGVGFLKAGIFYADWITTVSPTYAAEIQTPQGGMGMHGLLRARSDRLTGILNGIDEEVWDPAHDPHLPHRFARNGLGPRALNKSDLQNRLGLAPDPEALLFGVISRLSWQKGLDLLLDALPDLLTGAAQLAVLGAGEAPLESGFAAAAHAYPGRVGVMLGYDEVLAHMIQGGSDALLVPSRFEPCGLTQLCALRYGCVPVVSRIGGLADTVVDANDAAVSAGVATGVQFWPVARDNLSLALRRTQDLWREKQSWLRVQANGMASDVGWQKPARRYAALYRKVSVRP